MLAHTHYIPCLKLFPGPLKVICETFSNETVPIIEHVVKEDDHGAQVLTYLLEWFATWKIHGRLIPCNLTLPELERYNWQLSSCQDVVALFHTCVEKQWWEILEWCETQHPNLFRFHEEQVLLFADQWVEEGNIRPLKWLRDRCALGDIPYYFHMSCRCGHLEIAKWLYELSGEKEQDRILALQSCDSLEFNFQRVCEEGPLALVEWLCHLGFTSQEFSLQTLNKAFTHACYGGCWEIVSWLLNQGVDIHTDNELAFRYCCQNGDLFMAQWLYNLGRKIDIHAENEYAFCTSLANGHLHVTKWLYELADTSVPVPL